MSNIALVSSDRDQVASRARGRQRRKEIVDAAKAVLMEKGYGGLVMRDVATRAGIRIGNLHYYFPTKQALFLAIFDQESAVYAENLREAIAMASSRAGRLTAIVDTGLAVIKDPEVMLWRVLIALAQHDADADKILQREHRAFHEATARELLLIEPGLTEQRAWHIARLIWAMLDGLSLQLDYSQLESAETRALEAEARGVFLSMVDAP